MSLREILMNMCFSEQNINGEPPVSVKKRRPSFQGVTENMVFKNVDTDQIDQAYKILCAGIDELIRKGTGQYVCYYPAKEIYIERNTRKENWCLVRNNRITGIVSLTADVLPQEWKDVYSAGSFYRLSSFFVDPAEKGNGYGKVILNECVKKAKRGGIKEILLDCYMNSGFLVPYYEKNGFSKIAEKEFVYGNRKFSAALMRKEI